MSRLFWCLLFVFAARWFWRWYCKAQKAQREIRYGRPTPRQDLPSEQMVHCVECGIYIPLSQARRLGQQAFCCREHF